MANVEKAKEMLKRALEERSGVVDMSEYEKDKGVADGKGYAYMTGVLVACIEMALKELED